MRPLGSLDVQLTLSLRKGNCGDPFVYLRNIFVYFLQVLLFVEYHWHVFLALNKYLITGVLEAPPSLLYVFFCVFFCFLSEGWVGRWFKVVIPNTILIVSCRCLYNHNYDLCRVGPRRGAFPC